MWCAWITRRSHALDAKLAKEFTEKISDRYSNVRRRDRSGLRQGALEARHDGLCQTREGARKAGFRRPQPAEFSGVCIGVTLLTPNIAEAETLCGLTPQRSNVAGKDDERLERMAFQILNETDAEHAIITCGEWGMVSVSRGVAGLSRIPTFARDVFDVTGAGDTVIAVLALMSVLGHPFPLCMQVANAAAGIVVGHIGAAR